MLRAHGETRNGSRNGSRQQRRQTPMQHTLIYWASYWDGGIALAGVTILFLLGGVIFVPRPAICVLGGLTFGLAAIPIALIASTCGAVIGFLLSRYFFRARFLRILERRPNVKLVAEAVDAEGWRLLVLLRFASPIPAPISNYAFGLSRMKIWPFVLATALGSAPQILAFVYLGFIGKAALDEGAISSTKLMFAVAGCVVLFLGVALVTHRVRQLVRARLAENPG